MASSRSSTWFHRSLLMASVLLAAVTALSRVSADDIQTSGVPTTSLLCISECGTCPAICSPPPSPPSPPESGTFPPLIPTPSSPSPSLLPPPSTPLLLPPSTPLLLPPSAPIFGDFSPPPSYHAHPPPRQPPAAPKEPSSSSTPLVTSPKSAQAPPTLPYVIVPGGPTPPLGQGSNYPQPYYYFYSNDASLPIALPGYCCFSFLLLLLIHVLCSCT